MQGQVTRAMALLFASMSPTERRRAEIEIKKIQAQCLRSKSYSCEFYL